MYWLFSSQRSPSRTAVRLTPSRRQSSRSGGSRCPGRYSCSRMAARRRPATWSPSRTRRGRSRKSTIGPDYRLRAWKRQAAFTAAAAVSAVDGLPAGVDVRPAHLQGGIPAAHFQDPGSRDLPDHQLLGLVAGGDRHAHRVVDRAEPDAALIDLAARGEVDGVLDGAGPTERLPVELLQRAANPGRREQDQLGAALDEVARHLREAQL